MLDFRNKISLLEHKASMMQYSFDKLRPIKDLKPFAYSDYFSQFQDVVELMVAEDALPQSRTILPRNGYIMLMLPFSDNQPLRYRFAQIDNQSVRIGKLLEFLDYCAGISSVRALKLIEDGDAKFPGSIVTASMDHVKIFHQIPLSKDLYV